MGFGGGLPEWVGVSAALAHDHAGGGRLWFRGLALLGSAFGHEESLPVWSGLKMLNLGDAGQAYFAAGSATENPKPWRDATSCGPCQGAAAFRPCAGQVREPLDSSHRAFGLGPFGCSCEARFGCPSLPSTPASLAMRGLAYGHSAGRTGLLFSGLGAAIAEFCGAGAGLEWSPAPDALSAAPGPHLAVHVDLSRHAIHAAPPE